MPVYLLASLVLKGNYMLYCKKQFYVKTSVPTKTSLNKGNKNMPCVSLYFDFIKKKESHCHRSICLK